MHSVYSNFKRGVNTELRQKEVIKKVSICAELTQINVFLNCASRFCETVTTLQHFNHYLGIGSIPNSVLLFLDQHKDLGVHTEMFSDGVVDLVERGCITNAKKNLRPGKIVSSFAMGSRNLFKFIHNNPSVGEIFIFIILHDTHSLGPV